MHMEMVAILFDHIYTWYATHIHIATVWVVYVVFKGHTFH